MAQITEQRRLRCQKDHNWHPARKYASRHSTGESASLTAASFRRRQRTPGSTLGSTSRDPHSFPFRGHPQRSRCAGRHGLRHRAIHLRTHRRPIRRRPGRDHRLRRSKCHRADRVPHGRLTYRSRVLPRGQTVSDGLAAVRRITSIGSTTRRRRREILGGQTTPQIRLRDPTTG